MRVTRLFHPEPLSLNSDVTLDEENAHYVARVLRLEPGATMILFNGRGGEYSAELAHVDKRSAHVRLLAFRETNVESPLNLTLAQGISKGDHMDITIQKATELGVKRIIPVITDRTVVNLSGERQDKRQRHWQLIALNACQQCTRNVPPEICTPIRLTDFIARTDLGTGYVLHPEAGVQLKQLPPPNGSVTLLIGPEGGLSEEEIALATRKGFNALGLGPRILRTETAAITAIAGFQMFWGDLG